MRQLHKALRENHHLRHGGRMQYGLFLKGIGLTLDQALQFWRSEFVKGKVDVDKVNITAPLTLSCSCSHLAHSPLSVYFTLLLCWCTLPRLSFNKSQVRVTQTNESFHTVRGMLEIIWHSSSVSLIKKFWGTHFFFFVPMVHLTRKLPSLTESSVCLVISPSEGMFIPSWFSIKEKLMAFTSLPENDCPDGDAFEYI